jgi:membrane-bound acyltransferase YfiQ involved in biofilm formation
MVMIVGIALLVFNVLLAAAMMIMTKDFQGMYSSFSRKYILKVAIDSLVHTAIVPILGFIIAGIVRNKKYFGYMTEGIRAIRSAKELILAVSIPFLMVPYFSSTLSNDQRRGCGSSGGCAGRGVV